jgi:hypothetical protein
MSRQELGKTPWNRNDRSRSSVASPAMDVTGWDLVVAGVIAALILITVLALWLAGRSRGS